MNIAHDDDEADDWYDDEDRNRYCSSSLQIFEEAKWLEEVEDNRKTE
jgi:hypothetical protein